MKYKVTNKEIRLKSMQSDLESLVPARLLLPILAPGACQVCLGFDHHHHHRHHHPHHLHQHFHHNQRILNTSVCLSSQSSFDRIYPFLHVVPPQGDHYRHHNHHKLFLRWLHICIAKPHLVTDAIALLWLPKVLCCFSSLYFPFLF